VILDAWREVLAQVLHTRDTEWKDQLRAIKAESMAAVAELRVAAAEFRNMMEATVTRRLAQIRQPVDGKGPRGEPGPRGEAGPPGRIESVRAYVEDVVNYEGDIVVCDGSTYLAKCDTGRAPPHADWACIAAAGRDARMPNVCGTYREGETYKYLDIVALGGSSFVARADDPGPCPGDGWQLVATAGRAGKPGPKGERGERGLPGQAGPTIRCWQIDPERYQATPLMSDGTEGPTLELRALFEQYHTEAR
jgi:hypothetical protein